MLCSYELFAQKDLHLKILLIFLINVKYICIIDWYLKLMLLLNVNYKYAKISCGNVDKYLQNFRIYLPLNTLPKRIFYFW